MTVWATPADLVQASEFYGTTPPPLAHREKLLRLASADVARHLGAEHDPLLLFPDQVEALRDAACAQALYRFGQDAALGLDDGLASVGPLVVSLRQPPRFSPESGEILADQGLYLRSGTVTPWPL